MSAFTFSSFAGDKMDHKKMTHEMNISDTAASTKLFSTLTAALKSGGKKEMLEEDKGPFTVSAPTAEAFAKLPAGTVENLLKPENKEKLGKILAYHVLKGKVMAADVKTMKADTAEGSELNVKVDDGKVMVNDANVIKTDIAAINGVIHVIDTVLMPPDLK
ncbi:MAG: fasciclin domain-containing protein [Chthoniobacterales bacterium]|nr:fasciclin domain-containing protein [Chthoniobacterales bacterium]